MGAVYPPPSSPPSLLFLVLYIVPALTISLGPGAKGGYAGNKKSIIFLKRIFFSKGWLKSEIPPAVLGMLNLVRLGREGGGGGGGGGDGWGEPEVCIPEISVFNCQVRFLYFLCELPVLLCLV